QGVPRAFFCCVKWLCFCRHNSLEVFLIAGVGVPCDVVSFCLNHLYSLLNRQRLNSGSAGLLHRKIVVLYCIHNCNALLQIHSLSPFCTSYNPNDLSALYFAFLGVLSILADSNAYLIASTQ